MMFLFEEIVVEGAFIIATLVAAACLLVLLAGFALQGRALGRRASASDLAVSTHDLRGAQRAARAVSSFTPTNG